uniref:CSON005356 protein n=1 Tax=Culicoides sonorensis TaxID=179676 RepID=A0A336LYH4_CULSO
MNKLRLKYSKNNNNEDDDNCIINDNNNHIDGERGEIKQKMKKKQNQNNYYKKYQITHKMYNLIYVIALVTLSMNIVSIVPLSDAALHEKNITRLTDVEPPATSSLQDRMSTIYAISPTSRSLKQGANNCTFIHENQLKNDKIKGKDSTESDSSDFSASIEDLPDDSNFDVSSHYLGKVPVLGDPDESFRRVSTCQTCNRSHDDIIEASLKSIHDLVLLKLGFSTPPNMTNKAAIPKIPQKIVDGFLKQHYMNKQHPVYGKGRHDNMDQDMQGDDPNVMEKYYDNYPKEIYEEEDDDYFPITERVYVFPKIYGFEEF